jgi:hypothetical protein
MADFGTAGGSLIGAVNPAIMQNDSALLQLIANMPSKLQDMSTSRAQRQQALMEMALAPVKAKQREAEIEAANARTEAIKLKYMNQLNFQREMSGLPPLDVSNLTGGAMPVTSGASYDSSGGTQSPLKQMINPVNDPQVEGDMPPVDLNEMGTGGGESLAEVEIQQQSPMQSLVQPQLGGGDEVARKVAIANKYGQPTNNIISEANYGVAKERLGLEKEKASPEYVQMKERTKQDEQGRQKYTSENLDMTDMVINGAEDVMTIKTQLDSMRDDAVKTGYAAPAVQIFNSLAKQVGVDIPTLDSGSKMEVIESASNKLVTPLAKQLGVNPTDFDFKNIKSTVASAGKSMAGNYALVDIQQQAIKRAQELQGIIIDGKEQGLSEAQIRKQVNQFKKKQHVFPAVAMPKDPKKLKVGERYVDDSGVAIWNGKTFEGTE